MSADTTDGRMPDMGRSLDQTSLYPTEEQITGFLGRRFKHGLAEGEFIHADKTTGKRLYLLFPTASYQEFSLFVDGGISIVVPAPTSVTLENPDKAYSKQLVVDSINTRFSLRTSDLTAFISINEPRITRLLPRIHIPLRETLRSLQAPNPAK